ncbi:MAG: Flp pilus assembly protein CpaB [Aeromicrobium sp.]
MNKRAIAAVAAVALTAAGIVSVIGYVHGADERAFAGTELSQTWQVKSSIPAGAGVDEVKQNVEQVNLPVAAVAAGAVTSFNQLEGLATTVSLEPGEQLLLSRFAKPGEGAKVTNSSSIPEGMQELTIALTAPRLLGQHIKAGDVVGVFASYEDVKQTNVVENHVFVLRVDKSVVQDGGDQQATRMVTFAVNTITAEKIVHASEFGHIWLTKQNPKTDLGNPVRIEVKDVVR